MPKATRGPGVHGIYRFGFAFFRPIMAMMIRRHWRGMENLPTEGGFILAPNHMSNFDPVQMGYFVAAQGYETRFLAKASLFSVPVVGPFMKKWGMIPVLRASKEATDSLVHARDALTSGDVVGIYFEGTLTRDPAYWPMKGKTGVSRLALDTGVPILPVVQWGPQDVMERYSPALRGKKTDIYVRVLPPLDLSDLAGATSDDHEAVREVTRRLQVALEEGSSLLRGELPPRTPWDRNLERDVDKKTLKSFARWRRQLAKANHKQDILAAAPDVDRHSLPRPRWRS